MAERHCGTLFADSAEKCWMKGVEPNIKGLQGNYILDKLLLQNLDNASNAMHREFDEETKFSQYRTENLNAR